MKYSRNKQKLKAALGKGHKDRFFAALIDIYEPRVLAMAHANLPPYDRATEPEDIAAEVFARLSKKGLEPYSEASLGTIHNLVYTVTLNCLRSHARRSKKRAAEFSAAAHLSQTNMAADPGVTWLEYAGELREGLQRLTPLQRAVFERKLNGFRHDEIARQLDITAAGARQHLRQARRWLREWAASRW